MSFKCRAGCDKKLPSERGRKTHESRVHKGVVVDEDAAAAAAMRADHDERMGLTPDIDDRPEIKVELERGQDVRMDELDDLRRIVTEVRGLTPAGRAYLRELLAS